MLGGKIFVFLIYKQRIKFCDIIYKKNVNSNYNLSFQSFNKKCKKIYKKIETKFFLVRII
jgi:hypothetical protein